MTNPVFTSYGHIQHWWIISNACDDGVNPGSTGWIYDRSIADTSIIYQAIKAVV